MITLSTESCTPMDAWSTFTAMTLHFNSERDYDAFKFNFKGPRCKRETFIFTPLQTFLLVINGLASVMKGRITSGLERSKRSITISKEMYQHLGKKLKRNR